MGVEEARVSMSAPEGESPLARMRGIGKRFSGVRVLEGVDFDVRAGEVHVLAGENGAGKSTLMNILGGVYADYEGTVEVAGAVLRAASVAEAERRGIAMIHQELSLVPQLTVAENLFLGHERGRGAWLRSREERARARAVLARLSLAVDPGMPVEAMTVAAQQMVEIGKALLREARVIVMDEPTSALTRVDVEQLFAVIADLKRSGCGIVYITHRMDEIYRVADRLTVLRDGRRIGTASAGDLPPAELVRWMVGRELNQRFPARTPGRGGIRLAARDIAVAAARTGECSVKRASLSVGAGEIVGVAGLEGAGNHALLRALCGIRDGGVGSGRVEVDGRPVEPLAPASAIAAGIVYATNDRKGDGLVLTMSVQENVTLASLRRHARRGGWLGTAAERRAAGAAAAATGVRARGLDQPAGELSGGNQQKVLLARCLETRPAVLLLDEPTRGIDVGAKQEIYDLMNRWSREGTAIVLITSELPELLALSDRILVMHRGAIVAELPGGATQEEVLRAAMGAGGRGAAA